VKEVQSVLCEVETTILNFITVKFQTDRGVGQTAGCRPGTAESPSSNPSPVYVKYMVDNISKGHVFPQTIPLSSASVIPSSLYNGLQFHAAVY
jgi:hypothetical protein